MTPPAPAPRAAVLWVVLAFALAALPGLPDLPLRRASQARAWVVAREMAESGDYLVPRYRGETRLKKPPLQSWVQAAGMRASGSGALEVAGAMSWLVGLLFALGPLLIGRALGRPWAGFLGSLLLCGTKATAWWGASPEHDIPFAGLVAASFAALAVSRGPDARTRHAWLAGLLCGAAVLVKGPFALAFVLGTALATEARARRTAVGLAGLRLWPALLVGTLLPVAVWLAAVASRLGSLDAVWGELARQATGSEGAHVPGGVLRFVYYLGAIPKWALPVAPLAVLASVVVWKRAPVRESPSLHFAGVACLVTFLVLTATPAKQEHYLLSLLPPLFLLGGGAFERVAPLFARRPALLPSLVAGAAAAFAATRIVSARAYASPTLLAAQGLALALLVLLAARGTRRMGSLQALAAAAFVSAACLGLAARRDAVRGLAEEDFRDAAARIEARAPANTPLIGFAPGSGEAFDVLVAWVRRPYERVRDPSALEAAARAGPGSLVLVREPDLRAASATGIAFTRVFVAAPPRPKAGKDRVTVFRAP